MRRADTRPIWGTMRLRVLACSCLLVAASVGGVKTLAASPDCARWVREYQQGLANRASLAKKHVVHAARHLGVPRMRLAHATVPPHRLRPAKLSPQEMLKRFRVLCGEDLPDDTMPVSFVPANLDALLIPPAVFPDAAPITDLGQPVTFAPGADVVPQPLTQTTPTGSTVPPPVIVTDSGAPPITNTPPSEIIPPVVTPSPVPEPTSLLLMLTGVAGAVPIVMRRRNA